MLKAMSSNRRRIGYTEGVVHPRATTSQVVLNRREVIDSGPGVALAQAAYAGKASALHGTLTTTRLLQVDHPQTFRQMSQCEKPVNPAPQLPTCQQRLRQLWKTLLLPRHVPPRGRPPRKLEAMGGRPAHGDCGSQRRGAVDHCRFFGRKYAEVGPTLVVCRRSLCGLQSWGRVGVAAEAFPMPEGSEPPRFLAAGSTLTTNILRCTALLPVAAQQSVTLCVGPALLEQHSVNMQNLLVRDNIEFCK